MKHKIGFFRPQIPIRNDLLSIVLSESQRLLRRLDFRLFIFELPKFVPYELQILKQLILRLVLINVFLVISGCIQLNLFQKLNELLIARELRNALIRGLLVRFLGLWNCALLVERS
jgi:hypothetical protein